jgi:hypothetical protein
MVDTNNDIKSGPSSLTFEELSDILDRYNVLYKQLKCLAKDKPDCYIGLRAENDPKRIYKVILIDKIIKKRAFRIKWPPYIPLDNSFENIPAESGRFVLPKYGNVTESSFVAENYPKTITITNKNYRNLGSSPSLYRPYNTEGKSNLDYDARMNAAMQASIVGDFPEEQRESNPGPPSKNVRFREEPTVMNTPNCPNPTEYMGDMNEEQALAKALALSVGQDVSGGATQHNIEPPAIPTPNLPTTRDLSEVQFDLVIEEISQHPTARAPASMTMYEQKQSKVVVPPDFLRDDLKVDLYDGFAAETTEEWLERLKLKNVVSESDHLKADIYLD